MKVVIISILLFCSSFGVVMAGAVYDVKNKKYISIEDLTSNISLEANVVLGEYHYNDSIQKGEAEIIDAIVSAKNRLDDFTVAWEFLNYEDREITSDAFSRYVAGEFDGRELMKRFFFRSSDTSNNAPYIHVARATKDLGGEFIGVNVSREIKRVVIKDGLEGIDPEVIPPNFVIGGDNYLERFTETMGGHVPPEMVMPYFLAQSLTDSVMAYQIEQQANTSLRFLVVGAFHSDYLDGVVTQIKRYSELETKVIKIVNRSEMSEDEIDELLSENSKYGEIANYIYLMD